MQTVQKYMKWKVKGSPLNLPLCSETSPVRAKPFGCCCRLADGWWIGYAVTGPWFLYKMCVPTIALSDCVRRKWVRAERLANGWHYYNYRFC